MARTETTIINSKPKQAIILLIKNKGSMGIRQIGKELNKAHSSNWEQLKWLVDNSILFKDDKAKYHLHIYDNVLFEIQPKIEDLKKQLRYWERFNN